jgi:hypothetical protein
MRDWDFALIRLEGHGYRLYDLAPDPGETADVRERHPAPFTTMKAALIESHCEQVAPWRYADEARSAVTYRDSPHPHERAAARNGTATPRGWLDERQVAQLWFPFTHCPL